MQVLLLGYALRSGIMHKHLVQTGTVNDTPRHIIGIPSLRIQLYETFYKRGKILELVPGAGIQPAVIPVQTGDHPP